MRIKTYFLALSVVALAACNNSNKEQSNSVAPTDSTTTVTDANNSTGASQHDAGEAAETHELNKMGAGPHQGIAVEASNGHMEMTLEGKDAAFYPLDERTELINANGWSGKAIVQYSDGDSKTLTLNNTNGKLVAQGINTGENFKAVVTLTNNGQSVSATFNNGTASTDGHTDHDHADGHEHHH